MEFRGSAFRVSRFRISCAGLLSGDALNITFKMEIECLRASDERSGTKFQALGFRS